MTASDSNLGRPPLPLGTNGSIRIYPTARGYRARTLTRDHDGVTRAVERTAKTKAAAERSLKFAIRDRAYATSRTLTADSTRQRAGGNWYGSRSWSPRTRTRLMRT